ncbi:LETM1 domain-containing protein 1 isoform X4 [Oenanthe melanoleuca]|uniref:LETM1 domain-containing protein 1 isoform X4 n=1 Tax=Oenanthe melanoleuca TaxID=2939378 RepID=UPI0024C1B2CF|nr:LETM1 domain-containing protein 1 isoform X4 [Oenanthe melanoleuca]XP_056371057.1 LETM1 domain-containing protein 1 isoform X4 [Oenanthe melanoleuca]
MALSGAAARGALWRLGPAALSGLRGRTEPRLLLGASSSQLCSQLRSQLRFQLRPLSSRALAAAVASAARRVNDRYERCLQRSFPGFYLLHSTFKNGIQALFLEVKEIRRIRAKMSQQRLSTQQLPYREMERLRQFRRDVLKALPIGIIAIPPFANFLVIVLMYLFPRQLLIRHFWTPRQQQQFLEADGRRRRGRYPGVLRGLALAAGALPGQGGQEQLQRLCDQVCAPRNTPAELCAQVCAPKPSLSSVTRYMPSASPLLSSVPSSVPRCRGVPIPSWPSSWLSGVCSLARCWPSAGSQRITW